MNKHQIAGDWKIISGRIHHLWAKAFNDQRGVIEGELTEIAGVLQREFGVTVERAQEQIDRWRSEQQPKALIEAQWLRFNTALQDRWAELRARLEKGGAEAQELRKAVEADTAELIAHLQQRYDLSKDEAAAQVQAWLDDVRLWIEAHRPSKT